VYKGSFFPASSPTFVVGGVFDDSYLTRVKWNLSVVLICISFIARDGEHVFMLFFWPFGFLPLKKFCIVQLPTYLLVH
jgi:hypothetical protein